MAIFGFKRFSDVSISRKLYFTVGIMATLIVVELFTLWFAINTLSSLRSYVEGEGLWSKGQKDAVFHLQKYGHTHNPADYQAFLDFMKVPLGDHKARTELLKPEPNIDIARQGFIEGRNNPADIDGMIYLFRRFHEIYYIKKAIGIWGAADPLIMRMEPIAEDLHAEILSPNPSQEKIDHYLSQIEDNNEQLTLLEDEFSFTLGEASRWLEDVVLKLLFTVCLTVEISGLLLTISVSRNIQKGLNELIRAFKDLARGNFGARAEAYSNDEIGVLAGSFNKMAVELGHNVEEREKAEGKFKLLLESAPDAIVIVNAGGIIQLINVQTENLFGYNRNELVGKKVEMLIPAGSHEQHVENRKKYFANPKTLTMGSGLELFGKRKDGVEFPIEVSLSPLNTDEGLLVSAAIRDITAKKKADEALKEYSRKLEQSNNSLEQFAYVASHDLQEPLRTITNFVTLLEEKQKGVTDEASVTYMNYISTAANRMKVLIKDMLYFSRVGKKHVVEDVECRKLVADVLLDMEMFIKENDAVVNIGPLPMIKASKTEMRQLFQNLLNNAIKYRKPNALPMVDVRAEKKEANEWLFSIRDNGIGIDNKFKDRIFVIFQRLHNQNAYSGTGIGLATCKKIVEINNGKIWMESTPGQGSTFYFTLPQT